MFRVVVFVKFIVVRPFVIVFIVLMHLIVKFTVIIVEELLMETFMILRKISVKSLTYITTISIINDLLLLRKASVIAKASLALELVRLTPILVSIICLVIYCLI